MLLPNNQNAYIDTNKIVSYCLNPDHIVGRHKAYVFESILGLTRENYYILEDAIYNAVSKYDAIFPEKTQFGKHYIVDFPIEYNHKKAIIRTGWIIKNNEDFPRLTTCYIK